MDLKKTNAPLSSVTYDRNEIDATTGNIYEAISVISRRAEQINTDIRRELVDKLEEFATYNDSLEEIFENKEQIEVSKFYEKLEKTIGDPPDGIIFSFLTEVYNYDKHTVRMRAERKLTPSVKWQERSIAIDRYISKLKKLFPDWKFHIKE